MTPKLKAVAETILAKIRAEERPGLTIHTGPIEEMRDSDRPGNVAANEYIERWLEDPKHQAKASILPTDLENEIVGIGEWAHPLSWAHCQNDYEAFELQRRLLLAQANEGQQIAKTMLPHLMVADAFNAFGWQGKWYHYGCQSIEIDDKYAASLCATKIAKTELDYVRLPWPCFIVRAPKFLQGLLVNGEPLRLIVVNHIQYTGRVTITGPKAKEVEGQTVTSTLDRFSLSLLTANKYRILPAQTLSEWTTLRPRTGYDEFRLIEVEHSEIDLRQLEIIGRLVLGAIIAMNDEKIHKRLMGSGRKPLLGSPRYGTNNHVVLHKIGRPVKIDARDTIARYVSGRTASVTNVRTLVAGHWKNQPHGPKSSLRRWQHVECYWRGDADAPLIIRPHVLTGG
jgi:hypothetical protein